MHKNCYSKLNKETKQTKKAKSQFRLFDITLFKKCTVFLQRKNNKSGMIYMNGVN